MSNQTFNSEISDTVRQNTEALFKWLRDDDNRGKTPLLEPYLKTGGVDALARDLLGDTLLQVATAKGNIAAMKWLQQQGAYMEVTTREGKTLLHTAVRNNQPAAIEWLVEQGANLEAREINGSTPLNMATAGSLSHCFLALRDNGANRNAVNNFGTNPAANSVFSTELPQRIFDEWHDQTLSPSDLTKTHIMQMLNVWPLADPQAPVPRFEHLDAIFKDERWNEVDPQQKLDLIKEIPGLSEREQMYLLGGQAMRVLMKNEAQHGAER